MIQDFEVRLETEQGDSLVEVWALFDLEGHITDILSVYIHDKQLREQYKTDSDLEDIIHKTCKSLIYQDDFGRINSFIIGYE